jgi:hypothetical protein
MRRQGIKRLESRIRKIHKSITQYSQLAPVKGEMSKNSTTTQMPTLINPINKSKSPIPGSNMKSMIRRRRINNIN